MHTPQPNAPDAARAPRDDDVHETSTEIYLGNVSAAADAAQVLELFSLAGPADMSVPRNADGSHKGFMFGKYANARIADYAIRLLDGIQLDGQPLRARYASSSSTAR
jgi:RNA recognition motif-containing protein